MCGYCICIRKRVGGSERTVVTSRSLGENDTCKFSFFVISKRGKKLIVFNVTAKMAVASKQHKAFAATFCSAHNITSPYDSFLILLIQRWENATFSNFSSKYDKCIFIIFSISKFFVYTTFQTNVFVNPRNTIFIKEMKNIYFLKHRIMRNNK